MVTYLNALREANKHFYYAFVRSNLVNGISSDTVVKGFTPWWQIMLILVTGIFALFTIFNIYKLCICSVQPAKGDIIC